MYKVKSVLCLVLAVAMCAMMGVVAFADDGRASSGVDFSASVITEDMFEPLLDGIMSNIQVILPVGLGLLVIFLVIRVILIEFNLYVPGYGFWFTWKGVHYK